MTLTASYTPHPEGVLREGDSLSIQGDGNFTFGYFGGIMDASTGLLYVGNGQYYDPQTGRFLTRGVSPNQTNPYVPCPFRVLREKGDPAGSLIAPLALLAMAFGKKKTRTKADQRVILLVLCVAVGVSLAGCGGSGETPTPDMDELTVVATPGENILVENAEGTVIATMPPPNGTPTVTATPCPTVEIILTRTPTPTYPAYDDYAGMLLATVLNFKNDLPPGFSVALLLAIATVESGGNVEAYRNSTTHGGAFQLTANSGHYHHPYADTPEGYDQNVVDAIAVINENYGYAQTAKKTGTYFHFLYEEIYPQNPDEITAVVTVLVYNGCTRWETTNASEPINIPYVGNVANKLKNYVPTEFGYSDPTLLDILQSVQAIVNAYVP